MCGRKLGGGLWLFTLHFQNCLKVFCLQHILFLTKDKVFVLKTNKQWLAQILRFRSQCKLGCPGGVLLPDVPILWQSPQPELLTRKRHRSESLWRPPSNQLCRTPCPILATFLLPEGYLDCTLIGIQPPPILQKRGSSQEPCLVYHVSVHPLHCLCVVK